MTMHRTLEQRIKFDHCLPIGRSLVMLTLGEQERLAAVEITKRGLVHVLVKPGSADMYSSWKRIRGNDSCAVVGAIIVWGARNPEIMTELFSGNPVATIPVK